jgi:hypothetical protein
MPFAQEPKCRLKTAMLSGRTMYVIAPLQLGARVDRSEVASDKKGEASSAHRVCIRPPGSPKPVPSRLR